MAALKVISPYEVFTDVDGSPLEAGYIYIGTAGLNAEASAISVYWDEDLTVPASQPIRTIGGRASQNGTAANIFVDTVDYSITVKNKNQTVVNSVLSNAERGDLDYITPQMYGAVGDGTTNDSAAFNLCFEEFRKSAIGQSVKRRVLIPPADYFVGDGLDLTDIRFAATTDEGRGQIYGYGANLLGNTTGKKVIDCIRSLGIEIAGITIIGDQLNTPQIGIQYGRAESGQSADRILLRDVTVTGKYTFTSVYNLASEREHITDCIFRNDNDAVDTYAYVLDGFNEFGATSDFYTITIPLNEQQSNLSHLWEQTSFLKAPGSVNGPIYMSRFGRVNAVNCYAVAYSGYAITINTAGTALQDTNMNIHCETAGMVGAVYFDSTTANADMEGFIWKDNNSHASSAVFTAAPGVSVVLSSAYIHIGGYAVVPSTGLFDADSDFKVRGTLSLPIATGATLGTALDFVGNMIIPNNAGTDLIYPLGTQVVSDEITQGLITKGTHRYYSNSATGFAAPTLAAKDMLRLEDGGIFHGSDAATHITMSWGDSTTETEEWDFQSYSSNNALRFRRNPNSSSATITSGTATGAHQLNKLVDTGADFVTAGVSIGDVAVNTTDGTLDIVTLVAATELTFANDLFPLNTEAYTIRGPLQLGLAFLTEGHNRVARLEADPMSGTGGDFYYNTTLDQYRGYKDGTGWVTL